MASSPTSADNDKRTAEAEAAKIAAFKLHEAEVETQEEWDELMALQGLVVIDVYKGWCGPCKAMFGIFKKTKNLSMDPLLYFAIAKTDRVDSLSDYRSSSQPLFMFVASGVLVDVVRGIDAPLLVRTIESQLKREKVVLEGGAQRILFEDPVLAEMRSKLEADVQGREEDGEEEEEEGGKEEGNETGGEEAQNEEEEGEEEEGKGEEGTETIEIDSTKEEEEETIVTEE